MAIGGLQHQVARSLRVPHPLRLSACAAVVAGGIVGSLARYGVGAHMHHEVDQFPWSTLTVNVVGSLVIGFVLPRLPQPSLWRPFAVTGVLGGFTTMSTLAVDFSQLLLHDKATTAVTYLSATLLAGLGATALSALALQLQPVDEIDAVEAGL
jgi:fluoride exporter